jgi:hypothetical protein
VTDQDPARDPEREQDLEQVKDDLDDMDRYARAIALPSDEEEEGAGQVTHLVP